MPRYKKIINGICAVVGVLSFFALSGAVPENPNGNGLAQGIAATVLLIAAVVVSKKAGGLEDAE